MSRLLIWVGIVATLLFVAVSTSRSDTQAAQSASPQPGPAANSNGAYDVGGAAAIWPESSLTAEERAYVQRIRLMSNDTAARDVMGNAASQLEQRVMAEHAQHQLAIEGLDTIGVIP